LDGSTERSAQTLPHWTFGDVHVPVPSSTKSTEMSAMPLRRIVSDRFTAVPAIKVTGVGSLSQFGTEEAVRPPQAPLNAFAVTFAAPTGSPDTWNTELCPGVASKNRLTDLEPTTSSSMHPTSVGTWVTDSVISPRLSPWSGDVPPHEKPATPKRTTAAAHLICFMISSVSPENRQRWAR
jgi:hypothetical protein